MAKVIVVTSGKGGVGKTTTSASLATGLAKANHTTVVIDFDIGLRNLDLVMGCERRVVYDIGNVINGEAKLNQALIKDKRFPNLAILAASQTKDKEILTEEKVGAIIHELKSSFDYILCDSPAGIEKGALMAMYFADTAIVVTNPEISSARDSDRIIGLLHSKTQQAASKEKTIEEHLVITRYSDKRVNSGEMLGIKDIQELLNINLLGIVPESKSVLTASNKGIPVILDQKSEAGKAYDAIVKRFTGALPPFSLQKKRSFLDKLLKRSTEQMT